LLLELDKEIIYIGEVYKRTTAKYKRRVNVILRRRNLQKECKGKKPTIGLITSPIGPNGTIPLLNLVSILSALSTNLYVITGGAGYDSLANRSDINVYDIGVRKHQNETASGITLVLCSIYTQLKISFILVRTSRHANPWIFFIGGENLLLPMILVKLSKRKVFLALAGSVLKVASSENGRFIKLRTFTIAINRILTDKIIVYSQRLIADWCLEKYKSKVSIAHEHFLRFDKFKMDGDFSSRDNSVAYIGALSIAKGVTHLLEAIPEILKSDGRIRFLIGGQGELRDTVEEYIKQESYGKCVKFVGWIPHDELPKYLSSIKLLILPSFTEGLPNIMLEAMACGTPVLVTQVGAIPDIVKDGETGFLMEDNSPECIVKNVIRALNHPNLKQIADNARAFVESEFTYERAVDRYRSILVDVGLK
jgi:glycosyltransferase involved in cell wall biosynthesis